MTLYVGTSGWAYKEWKPAFYPQDLPPDRFLEHYGKTLTACEINATFYRLQTLETLGKWAQATPDSFRFALKAHRGLTHGRKIAVDEDTRPLFDAFMERAATLGEKLGAILFQFPPYRRRDDDALARLLEALPSHHAYAFEFRHDSWVSPDVRTAIAQRNGSVCVSNTDGTVPDVLPPGPLAYVRLRTDRYSEEAREGWRELLASTARDRNVFAFAKHEGIPTDDPYGGIGLARWFTNGS